MNYDNKSDYAINKNTDDIVYFFADGAEKRYRKENGKVYQINTTTDGTITKVELPTWEMSIDEFDRIKPISNSDYHEREKNDKRTTRENVSINKLLDTDCVADSSAEDKYIDYLDSLNAPPETRTLKNAMTILDKCLTETQKRRYISHYQDGLSTREIAKKEGLAQRTIMDCLELTEKKINKFFGRA